MIGRAEVNVLVYFSAALFITVLSEMCVIVVADATLVEVETLILPTYVIVDAATFIVLDISVKPET